MRNYQADEHRNNAYGVAPTEPVAPDSVAPTSPAVPEAPNEFRFTVDSLDALVPPARGRAYYQDLGRERLSLQVTAAGTKTFYIQLRINGTPRRVMLGHYPDVKIDAARRKAAARRMEVAAGADPYERTRAARQGVTVATLFEEFMERHARPHLSAKTAGQYEDVWRLHLAPLGPMRLAKVTRRDVESLHLKLGKTVGHRTANVAAGLIRNMFNRAIEWEMFDGRNPGDRIKKFPEQPRERFLNGDELARLFHVLEVMAAEDESPLWRDLILMHLLTGARRGNVLRMRWADIVQATATWTIGRSEMKGKKTVVVPLVPLAMTIIQSRRLLVPAACPWVFPSPMPKRILADGTRGVDAEPHPIEDPKARWERIRRDADIKDVRLHDLRRTLGSWLAASNTNLAIISKTLGHSTMAATAVYV